VVRRALEVLDRGVPELVKFSVSEAPELDVGLSCGGAIDVLIERLPEDDATSRALAVALANEKLTVLAQVIEPIALRGARLVVTGDGITAASIALPSTLTAAVAEEARPLLAGQGGTATIRVPLDGGDAIVFLEGFLPEPHLYVVGATEIAVALSRLAAVMGLHVTVIDPRRAYAIPERFDDTVEVVQSWPDEVLTSVSLGRQASVVTLTHDPKLDVPALMAALRAETGYIGALGSARTHEKRKQSLAAAGFAAEDIARVHGPVGLDIGGKAPEDIALSIVAEIVAARNGRDPRAKAFTSGIILAAGASTRMGRPKQLLPLDDKPLLQHMIDAAAASKLDEIVVVLGARAAEIRAAIKLPSDGRARIVVNERHAKGLSESVRVGLAATAPRSTAAAILLGDQPRVSADLIDRMLAAHASSGKAATRPIFGTKSDEPTPGHPVLLSRALWQMLRDLRGEEGARAVLAANAERVNEVRILATPPADIDTPADYEAASRQTATSGRAS